jgi:hypothetical protein
MQIYSIIIFTITIVNRFILVGDCLEGTISDKHIES